MRSTGVMAILLALTLPIAAGAKKSKNEETPEAESTSRLTASTFAGLKLRSIGPALMAGRIADIAVHPEIQSTWYVAVGSGGVWKTTNAGTTWEPIFDHEASYSIGCITLDPGQPEIVWVGSGENVSGRHVGYGDGVYKSLDGGTTWTNMGLGESEHIGNIVVHPQDSNTVYVAAQGPLWSAGGDRGLFKTTDGGKTWTKILGDSDFTGVNEVRMDPRNPDVLYAATHQRLRTVAALINGGPGSGIHKSTDGGETWREIRHGLPEEDMGKIGLAISPQNPDVVYAVVEIAGSKGIFYRSADRGETWEKRSEYKSTGTGPHYYQEIFASPHAFDRIYQMEVRLKVSDDGGTTFREVGEPHKHGDNQALAFDPGDPKYLLSGSDGGLYETWDLGKSWKFVANMPITQFYKVAVDYDEPFYNIYGGTQDNSTQGGPSRTDNNIGIRNSDWFITVFADGHQPAVDPTNPDIVYSEWQQGNLVRFDRKTGEIVYIKPQGEPGDPADRFNWDSPILISPHDPARLYFASQRVFRSDDRGDRWRPISGDLSRGQERLAMPMMDRVWSIDAIWDLSAMSKFGNVTSLAESPLVEGLLYAGTDDGLVQISEDGGASWRKVEVAALGVPPRSFVNDVKADLFDPDTLYVALDNHKEGDFAPYLVKSTDRGRTWTSISGALEAGGLPARHLVWRLVQDHEKASLLFAGTEFGVFFTVDGGEKWVKLTGGVPTISFRDLAIQKRENDLVGATFGRSFYVFDDYSPLRHVSEEILGREAELFVVKDAWWYIPRRPFVREKGTQGGAFYAAPNPPFGAVFTYYLRDGLKSRREERREQERKTAMAGGDTPSPGWEALREEAEEEDPAVLLTVRDASGEVVRRLAGPVGAGFHRVAWNLRYPSVAAWKPGGGRDDFPPGPKDGPLVAPGTYTVSLARRVDGVVSDLGLSQSFNVVPLRRGTLPGMEPGEMVAHLREGARLEREISAALASLGEASKKIGAIQEVLLRSTHEDTSLDKKARALKKELAAHLLALKGEEAKRTFGEPTPSSLHERLLFYKRASAFSTYGPTETHRRSLEIVRSGFAEVLQGLKRTLADLEALERELDRAGVPWTPGRGVSEP